MRREERRSNNTETSRAGDGLRGGKEVDVFDHQNEVTVTGAQRTEGRQNSGPTSKEVSRGQSTLRFAGLCPTTLVGAILTTGVTDTTQAPGYEGWTNG